MPTTLPNINLVTPDVGGSSGQWGSLLNAIFALLDEHDHTSGKGVLIRPGAIGINSDLTFNSFSATFMRSVVFSTGQAVTGARKLYVGANGELFWNNNGSGSPIQITSGTGLNLSFAGGIGGDYAAVSAALNYDDSLKRYTLKQGGGLLWARIAAGEVRLHEHNSSSSVHVALASPAALAATYTVTFPAAVPAAKRMVQVSSAGVLTFENTGVESVTMATDANVTLSGTGEIKHGDRVLTLSAAAYQASSGTTVTYASGPIRASAGGAADWWLPIPLKVGDRIKSISFAVFGDGAADITAYGVVVTTMAGGTSSLGASAVTNPAAAWATTTLDLTDTVLASGETATLILTTNGAGITFGNVAVTYDRP